MNNLIDELNKRIQQLRKAIKQAEREKSRLPDGRLRISKTAGRIRYYEVNENTDSSGKYLHKKEEYSKIKLLAQKDYNKQFLKTAQAELKKLEKFLEQYQKEPSRIHIRRIIRRKKTSRNTIHPTG